MQTTKNIRKFTISNYTGYSVLNLLFHLNIFRLKLSAQAFKLHTNISFLDINNYLKNPLWFNV